MAATSVDVNARLVSEAMATAARPRPTSRLAGEGFVWRPLEQAGEGSSAIVFKAQHRTSGQLAALKVVKGELGDVALREIALLGQLDRRWGPALFDAGVVPEGVTGLPSGARFVATEWIEGEALDPRRATDRERLAAYVAHGVGRALAELHEAGVRHGDVQPAHSLL
jgi:serine/threonine protein kinase